MVNITAALKVDGSIYARFNPSGAIMQIIIKDLKQQGDSDGIKNCSHRR